MTRPEAYTTLQKYLKNPNLIKHSLAAEATMKALYRYLSPKEQLNAQTEERWGITGLLHDADYEMVQGHPEKHGLLLFEKEPNIPGDIAYAIKSHNYQYTKVEPKMPMDWAITTCDQLTGLIVAAALVTPEKKLAKLSPESVMKRFKEKSFARGADRNTIQLCETKLGIKLPDFITITLVAMQGISKDLGL